MAGFRVNANRCRNKRNHNCSPCPYCECTDHDFNRNGHCAICGETESSVEFEGVRGGFTRIKGRVMKKHFDDEE